MDKDDLTGWKCTVHTAVWLGPLSSNPSILTFLDSTH